MKYKENNCYMILRSVLSLQNMNTSINNNMPNKCGEYRENNPASTPFAAFASPAAFAAPLCIAIIAKWIPDFGKTSDSAKNVESQWFVMDIITRNEFFNEIEIVMETVKFYRKNYNGDKRNVKLALVHPIQLSTRETIAIDYTYYVRLVQRLWRKKLASAK